MFDMDQFMADREAAKRPRPLSEQEHREYHSGDPEDEYRCHDCDAEFATADEMNDHIDDEHNEGYGEG